MDPNQLRKDASAKAASIESIQDQLDDENLSFNAEQRAQLEAKQDALLEEAKELKAKAEGIEADEEKAAKRRAAVREFTQSDKPARKSGKGTPETIDVSVGKPGFTSDPMKGFSSPKEFFGAVVSASTRPGRSADERLSYLAAVGSDEHTSGSDPYGGFFVPEGMSPELLSVGAEANPLLGSTTKIPMESPSIKINSRVDKDHSSSVSGGLTVSRRGETGGFNSSRMQTEQIELTVSTLAGLAFASEELLRDSPRSVAALLEAGFRDEFASQNVDDLISGTGVGEPTGVLNSSATITVAKEGSQAADTINGTNLLKMKQRAWRFGNSVWIANHDTQIQLTNAHTTLTNDDRPLFSYGNGTDVPDTILGRPVYFSEYASALGDKGDIMLLDMSQYLYGLYQPLESAESIHVRFENHEKAFKFTLRDAGAPWWKSALTPKKGANSLSPFVTLAARA